MIRVCLSHILNYAVYILYKRCYSHPPISTWVTLLFVIV